MNHTISLIVVLATFGVIFSVVPVAYSQTSDVETSEQITLSGNLLNDPIALEILKKIDESKRKIAKLQQQNYDNLQAQKFLEERRKVALDRLNEALILWEEKWYEFSPKVAYQKFIDKMPSSVKGVYAKQFEFTEKKHNAGLDAKTKALAKGMNTKYSTHEFRKAAQSSVGEITKYNEQIQPNYNENQKKLFSERVAYWSDMLDGRDQRIKKETSAIEREYKIHLSSISGKERIEIREVVKLYNLETINRYEFSFQVGDIREKYNPLKDKILKTKTHALSKVEIKYYNWTPHVIDKLMSSKHSMDLNLGIVWNSDDDRYEVVSQTTKFSTTHQPIIIGIITAPTEIQVFWESSQIIDYELVRGYKIEVKKDGQPFGILIKDTENKKTSYTHADLTSGEFYSYQISAITDVKVSEPSNVIRVGTATIK